MYYCFAACVVHCRSRLAAAGLPLEIRRRLLRRLAPTELALLTSATGALRTMDQDPSANAAEVTMLSRMRGLLRWKPSESEKVTDRLEELLERARSRGE